MLAIEQYGAGPWATMQLADLGADVIKIEDPASGGDVGRYVPPFQEGTDSLFFESFNRGKRSVLLDLRTRRRAGGLPQARGERGCRLLQSARRRAGAARAALRRPRQSNPRIVCCSLSAFGNDGPRAAEGGYDFTIQGLAGWQSLTGEPGHPPMRSGLSLVDLSAGYVAAIAIMAGVWRARRVGTRRRHRPLALRDRAGAAHLLRHMGGEPRLRSRAPAAIRPPVAGPVRELPDGATAGS